MWLFKKQKKNKEQPPSTADKVAGKIAGAGLKAQHYFAMGMTILFQRLPVKKRKIFFLLFCLSASGFSTYLIATAVTSNNKTTQPGFKIDPVEVPKYFDKAGDEVMSGISVDEETFYKIQGFRKYMDSLKKNKAQQYDSLVEARPGMLDSIHMLEEMYHSQKQK